MTVTAVSARIKFYPPLCGGAFKFIVQLLPTNNAAKNGLKAQDIFKGDASISGGDLIGEKPDAWEIIIHPFKSNRPFQPNGDHDTLFQN